MTVACIWKHLQHVCGLFSVNYSAAQSVPRKTDSVIFLMNSTIRYQRTSALSNISFNADVWINDFNLMICFFSNRHIHPRGVALRQNNEWMKQYIYCHSHAPSSSWLLKSNLTTRLNCKNESHWSSVIRWCALLCKYCRNASKWGARFLSNTIGNRAKTMSFSTHYFIKTVFAGLKINEHTNGFVCTFSRELENKFVKIWSSKIIQFSNNMNHNNQRLNLWIRCDPKSQGQMMPKLKLFRSHRFCLDFAALVWILSV